LARGGIDQIERNKSANSSSVLRFNHEMGHRPSDGVNDHTNHLATDPIGTAGVGSDRKLGLLCHTTYLVPLNPMVSTLLTPESS